MSRTFSTPGNCYKVCLVFPKIFWPLSIKRFGLLSDVEKGNEQFATLGKYLIIENQYTETNIPCLVVHTCGDAAIDMESKNDEEIINEIMNRLSFVFYSQQPLPYPIETVITRWSISNPVNTFSVDLCCENTDIPIIFAEKHLSDQRDSIKGIKILISCH